MPNLNFTGIDFSDLIEKPPELPPGAREYVEPIIFDDAPHTSDIDEPPNLKQHTASQYTSGSAQAPSSQPLQNPVQNYLPQRSPPQPPAQSFLPQQSPLQEVNLGPPQQIAKIPIGQIDLRGALLACEQAGFSSKEGRKFRHGNAIATGNNFTAYSLMQRLLTRVILRVKDKQLYQYTGTHYEPCSQQQAERLIVDVCRTEIAAVGASKLPKDVYSFLLMEPAISIDEADPDEKFLAFHNGLLDLSTGNLLPHSPQHFITYCLDCHLLTPDVPIPCPVFEHLLNDITGGDISMMTRIWEIIGYCLTPDMLGKAMFVFQGVPNSGKSLLCDLISSFFPPNKVSALDIHALKQQFAMSELEGKALCISADLPNAPLDAASVSNIKKLTGRDVVSADKKYSARKQFKFFGKIIAATNYPLLTTRRDDAFQERVVAVPFLYSVMPEKRINLLPNLLSERSAIARKALAAYFELRKRHYRFTGNYQLNQAAVLYAGPCQADNVVSQIYKFAQQHFAADPTCVVFMDDAYSLYSSLYGSVHINAFSPAFSTAAETFFGATKGRRRKVHAANATSCLQGIRLMEGMMV